MFDQPIPLPTTRFQVRTDDETFHVAWQGGTSFLLSGEVSMDPSAALELTTPSDNVELSLARRSGPPHAVALLRRSLPRDVVMTQALVGEDIRVAFHEAVVPAARPPQLRILASDSVQRVMQLRENAVEFIGAAGADGLVTVLVDTRRVTLRIPMGSSAQATAARVGAGVPSGYRALVDGATVSVWKDADFFEQVA